MRHCRPLVRVLLAMAAVSISVGAYVPAAAARPSTQPSHPVASASAGRFEAPLAQLKSLDAHQQRSDSEGRRIDVCILAGAAALAAAALLSIIRSRPVPRRTPVGRTRVRVRAPPLAARRLTGPPALI